MQMIFTYEGFKELIAPMTAVYLHLPLYWGLTLWLERN